MQTPDKKAARAAMLGVPIKDRDPADIADILSDLAPQDREQFLALHAYAQKNHLGISALGHQTGIPSGILSQCYSGAYPGDTGNIAARIAAFFHRLQQKELYGGLRSFVETRLAQSLWTVFDKARIIRRFVIVQSPEQLGKTRAAREYSARNNTGRTAYTLLSGGARHGCGDFIWGLAERLGIPYSIKLREKRIRILNALESCDLIIIDEAHLLWAWHDAAARDFLDYLRTDLYADGARGIVLIATNTDMLDGLNRFRRRANYNIGQLLGRMRNEIVTIDPHEDIIPADIAALVGRYYQPGTETVRLLHDIAQRDQLGHFGLIEDICNEAWTRAKSKKRPLDDATVTAVAREIIDTLKARKSLYQ